MNKHKPFGILQCDKTRRTFLILGEMSIEATDEEFEPIRELAMSLREHPKPVMFMNEMVKEWKKDLGEDDLTDSR